jgi:hypothetical protein
MAYTGANFEFWIGEDITMSLTCLQSDGTAFNLTGYTAAGVLKINPSSAVALNLVPTIPTPANGVVLVSVNTAAVAAGVYGWDVQIKLGANAPIVIGYGTAKLRKKNTP